jgi:hypothetical protein
MYAAPVGGGWRGRTGLNRARLAHRIRNRLRFEYPRCCLFAVEVLRHSTLAAKLLAFVNIPSAVRTPTRHALCSPPNDKCYSMVGDGSTVR